MKPRTKKLFYNITVGILIACAITWVSARFIHLGNVEYTDNAQIKQHIIPINARIQGFIKKIYFDEYQNVRKGDTLLLIEDTEFRYKLAQAEADYLNAQAGKTVMASTINTVQNNIDVSDIATQEAKIRLDNAEREHIRYKNLLTQDAVTKQQYDAVKTNYEAAQARYQLLLKQKKTTTLVKQEQDRRLEQTDAGIKLAQAALDLARLNLSYTIITAPCDGTTGRKEIQEGQLIQPGQTLLNLVDENQKWIIANYKETQTHHIRTGQIVNIQVDAIPGVTFEGFVKSISQATGASYSLIPQDNSAGNFVKVEQRIPIRIEFTRNNEQKHMQNLRSGMNAECEINY